MRCFSQVTLDGTRQFEGQRPGDLAHPNPRGGAVEVAIEAIADERCGIARLSALAVIPSSALTSRTPHRRDSSRAATGAKTRHARLPLVEHMRK